MLYPRADKSIQKFYNRVYSYKDNKKIFIHAYKYPLHEKKVRIPDFPHTDTRARIHAPHSIISKIRVCSSSLPTAAGDASLTRVPLHHLPLLPLFFVIRRFFVSPIQRYGGELFGARIAATGFSSNFPRNWSAAASQLCV